MYLWGLALLSTLGRPGTPALLFLPRVLGRLPELQERPSEVQGGGWAAPYGSADRETNHPQTISRKGRVRNNSWGTAGMGES